MKKKQFIFAFVLGILLFTFQLIVVIPSNSECGTSGLDMIPCTYHARLIWDLKNGFWITLTIIWIISNIVYFALLRRKAIRTEVAK
jgi:hypothetical protein